MPRVVFPIGAYRKELAADHLDRLLGKSILNWFVHHRGVAKDGHTGSTNQPQDGRDGGCQEAHGHRDTEQGRVQLGSVETPEAQVQVATVQLANSPETGADEDNEEHQSPVGQQAVDAEHDKDDGIVAREVAEVVVDATLDFTKVGGLGQALEVKEFRDRAQVGESGAHGLAADAVESIAEPRGDRVDGDLDGHGGRLGVEVKVGDRNNEDKGVKGKSGNPKKVEVRVSVVDEM